MKDIRLIDANALFAEFESSKWHDNADRDEVAEELLLAAPTIEPPQGEWAKAYMYKRADYGIIQEKCSVCKRIATRYSVQERYAYCPHCGAKMKGGEA